MRGFSSYAGMADLNSWLRAARMESTTFCSQPWSMVIHGIDYPSENWRHLAWHMSARKSRWIGCHGDLKKRQVTVFQLLITALPGSRRTHLHRPVAKAVGGKGHVLALSTVHPNGHFGRVALGVLAELQVVDIVEVLGQVPEVAVLLWRVSTYSGGQELAGNGSQPTCLPTPAAALGGG